MGIRGGKAPKITVLGGYAKVVPIPRDADNTDVLNAKADAVHEKYSHLRAPVGTKSKSANKGAFDPADNTAFNPSNPVTAPGT